jgi:glucose/mannose transport system permease protein
MRRRAFRGVTRDRVIALLLVSPSIIAIALFVYGFILWSGWVSLLRWDNLARFQGIFPAVPFRGLDTYLRLFQNDRFQIDIRNTVVFTLLFLFVCLLIGFALAVILDQRIRGEGLFRNIFLFPMAISFIVTGVAWRWLLAPRAGVNLVFDATINPVLTALGLPPLAPGWYTDPTVWHIPPGSPVGQAMSSIGLGGLASAKFGIPVAMLSIVIAAVWQMSGYVMALYLAGLRAIPEELREAARVDGATEPQIYRHIIVPLLTPITLSAIIILGHISLKIFDLVVSLSGPGPAFATDVPALFMFVTTFQGSHFSQGAAISIVMLLAVSVLVIPYLVYSIRTEVER